MPPPPPPVPPPPPGPPPPPALKLGGGAPPADGRNALLLSIQKGAKLKKTVTVDKSAPTIQGKVASDGGGSTTARTNNRAPGRPLGEEPATAPGVGGAKLGGLFEGLSSMPKLKPVGSRTPGNASSPGLQQNKTPSPEASKGSPTYNGRIGNGGGGGGTAAPLDFSDELAQKLTLKKQKHQQQQHSASSNNNNSNSNSVVSSAPSSAPALNAPPPVPNEANLRMNRGPPPQPPTAIHRPAIVEKSALVSSQKSQAPATPNHLKLAPGGKPLSAVNGPSSNSSITSTSPTIAPVPNRSALFGGNATTTTISNSTRSGNSKIVGNGSVTSAVPAAAPKPVPNYGKPNLAPKPPGMQLAIAGDGGGVGSASTRPTVSRHQSMRSPRSPPVSQTAPAFPANHFGTMRGPPSSAAMFQSSESIVRPARDAPGRPSGPPPKPPTMKPPPPPPVRSVSNTNLTHLPPSLSLAPSQDTNIGTGSPSTEPSSFGSVNNVSSLTLADELRAKMSANLAVSSVSSNSISTGNLSVVGGGGGAGTLTKGGSLKATVAPPLPPHRTSPAPPPPVPVSAAVLLNSADVPVPPQRISSIRNSAGSSLATATVISSSTSVSSHNQSHHSQSSTTTPTAASGSLHRKDSSLTSVSSSSSTTGGGPGSSKMPLPEIDLESKYSFYFHKVTELPQPIPFLNVQKVYPSEMRQQTSQAAQQQQRQ